MLYFPVAFTKNQKSFWENNNTHHVDITDDTNEISTRA